MTGTRISDMTSKALAPGDYAPVISGGANYRVDLGGALYGTVSLAQFPGFDPTGATDQYATFAAAHASVQPQGGIVHIPPGFYRLSSVLNLHGPVIWQGSGNYSRATNQTINGFTTNALGTTLLVDAGVAAFIINAYDTDGTGVVPAGTYPNSIYSQIRDMYIFSPGGGANIDGIYIRTTTELHNVSVRGFSRYGVHIEASEANPVIRGNANIWTAQSVDVIANGSTGFYVSGGDGNAGVGLRVNALGNSGWGIDDQSLLGNTWVACHASGNTLGGYRSANATPATFLGCYIEAGGAGVSSLVSFGDATTVLGNLAAETTPNPANTRAFVSTAGLAVGAPYRHQNRQGTVNIGSVVGSFQSDYAARQWGSSDDVTGYYDLREQYNTSTKYWELYNASAAKVWMRYPTTMASPAFYAPDFPEGCSISGSLIKAAASIPTTGSYTQGAFVRNTAGSVSGGKVLLGWYRLTTGSAHVAGTDWTAIYGTTT